MHIILPCHVPQRGPRALPVSLPALIKMALWCKSSKLLHNHELHCHVCHTLSTTFNIKSPSLTGACEDLLPSGSLACRYFPKFPKQTLTLTSVEWLAVFDSMASSVCLCFSLILKHLYLSPKTVLEWAFLGSYSWYPFHTQNCTLVCFVQTPFSYETNQPTKQNPLLSSRTGTWLMRSISLMSMGHPWPDAETVCPLVFSDIKIQPFKFQIVIPYQVTVFYWLIHFGNFKFWDLEFLVFGVVILVDNAKETQLFKWVWNGRGKQLDSGNWAQLWDVPRHLCLLVSRTH